MAGHRVGGLVACPEPTKSPKGIMCYMDRSNAQLAGAQGFQTFHSRAWEYLVKVHDRSARLFGLRYLNCVQARHHGMASGPAPKAETPAEGLVRAELDRIYQRHYDKRAMSEGLRGKAA